MTRDELIAAVPFYEYNGREYVHIADVPEPWREQFARAHAGSVAKFVPGIGVLAFVRDWDAWVRGQWDGRPGPKGLEPNRGKSAPRVRGER